MTDSTIDKLNSFARINGLAVMIMGMGDFNNKARVRFIGSKGMKIRKDYFDIDWKELEDF
jgi:hypothetical protein